MENEPENPEEELDKTEMGKSLSSASFVSSLCPRNADEDTEMQEADTASDGRVESPSVPDFAEAVRGFLY